MGSISEAFLLECLSSRQMAHDPLCRYCLMHQEPIEKRQRVSEMQALHSYGFIADRSLCTVTPYGDLSSRYMMPVACWRASPHFMHSTERGVVGSETDLHPPTRRLTPACGKTLVVECQTMHASVHVWRDRPVPRAILQRPPARHARTPSQPSDAAA